MLEIARKNTPTTSVPVEWRQGNMCTIPFPDGSFNVVLCQQGVQFVPDKFAALQEMRRVLVPGGRLAFTVWSEAPAWNVALAESLTRHVGTDVAMSCLSPFLWNDAENIRKLVSDAGFRDIEMQVLEFMRHEGALAEQVVLSMARLPIAPDIAALSEETRMQIGREVSAALQAYREGSDFVMPQKTHLVQAQSA